MNAPLPPYVQEKPIAAGIAYYWSVPKRTRPDIQVRCLPLGTDRDAACAIGRKMLEMANAKRPDIADPLKHQTSQAQRFAQLDALSRERALTNAESEELEQTMIDLRMIDL